MRNFILSPNLKNSVKASLLSLIILIASLNFGCCLNANAMFGYEFPYFEANLQNNENANSEIMFENEPFDLWNTFAYSSADATSKDEFEPNTQTNNNSEIMFRKFLPHAYPSVGNTPPTFVASSSGIVDFSNDIDDETFTNYMDILSEIPFPFNVRLAEDIAKHQFPNDPKKQKDLFDKLNFFNMGADKKRGYYEETGKGTPKHYKNQMKDALKFLHGKEPYNDDSCDEYIKSKYEESLPKK